MEKAQSKVGIICIHVIVHFMLMLLKKIINNSDKMIINVVGLEDKNQHFNQVNLEIIKEEIDDLVSLL